MIMRAILIAIAVIMATPLHAIAAGFSPQFYSGNDILFYDPRATACTSNSSVSSSGAGISSADENKNAEVILRYLTGKGMTLAQAAGFVGNMKQESGLNPAIIQGGGIADSSYTPVNEVGFGLVQWTFSTRQGPLVELATSTGRPITDINLQLDYVWQEINGGWKSTLQALAANPSVTPTEAAAIVHGNTNFGSDPRFTNAPRLGYEASADSADTVYRVRGGNAEYFYNMFRSQIQDGAGISADTTTTGGAAVSTTSSCFLGSYAATGTCPQTAPVYGEGGNGRQLRQADFEAIYGVGGPDVEPNLVSVDFLGKSVQVHKLAAACLQAVVDDINKSGISYTINQIGGYRGSGGAGMAALKDGYHYYGLAVDINWDTNPYIRGRGVSAPYDMPQQYVDIFHAHGWSWGGNWNSAKDYMHFEFNGLGP